MLLDMATILFFSGVLPHPEMRYNDIRYNDLCVARTPYPPVVHPCCGAFALYLRSILELRRSVPKSSYPCSTRVFMSRYAASISLLIASAFVAVPGLSFTWRMYLPVPSNKPVGSR